MNSLTLKFRVSTIEISPIEPTDANGSTYSFGKRVTLVLVDTADTHPDLAGSPRGDLHIGPLSAEASTLFEQGAEFDVTLALPVEASVEVPAVPIAEPAAVEAPPAPPEAPAVPEAQSAEVTAEPAPVAVAPEGYEFE